MRPNTCGEAVSYIDLSNLSEGSNAGIYFYSKAMNYMGVETNCSSKRLKVKVENKISKGPVISDNFLMLRIKIENTNGHFEFSLDGLNFIQLGSVFQTSALSNESLGIYCLNEKNGDGSLDIDWFYYTSHNDILTKFSELKDINLNPEL